MVNSDPVWADAMKSGNIRRAMSAFCCPDSIFIFLYKRASYITGQPRTCYIAKDDLKLCPPVPFRVLGWQTCSTTAGSSAGQTMGPHLPGKCSEPHPAPPGLFFLRQLLLCSTGWSSCLSLWVLGFLPVNVMSIFLNISVTRDRRF